MNAEISETIRARVLGLGLQILGIPAQPKFNAHSNARLARTFCNILSKFK